MFWLEWSILMRVKWSFAGSRLKVSTWNIQRGKFCLFLDTENRILLGPCNEKDQISTTHSVSENREFMVLLVEIQ